MGVFNLESFLLTSDISGFSFFSIDYIQKQPRKVFISSFLSVLRLFDYLSDFENSSRHFVLSEHNKESAAQSYCLKVGFLVIKVKMVLR